MRISHVAIWCKDLEKVRAFYCKYFQGSAGSKYVNQRTGFESYFIDFVSGARLELMSRPDVTQDAGKMEVFGFAHLAFTVGSPNAVDTLTWDMELAGVQVLKPPRQTGDGYYESVVADPEGNRVEIIA